MLKDKFFFFSENEWQAGSRSGSELLNSYDAYSAKVFAGLRNMFGADAKSILCSWV